ncbi:MAG: DUF2934 domain-containing protein [Myxococcales bacterium]|nr:DUF2934 domain-containing protein [Myxococcales bacterium]
MTYLIWHMLSLLLMSAAIGGLMVYVALARRLADADAGHRERLLSEIATLRGRVSTLQGDHDDQDSELSTLRIRYDKVQEDLQHAQADRDVQAQNFASTVNLHDSELARLQGRERALEDKILRLETDRAALVELRREHGELEARARADSDRLHHLQTDNARLTAHVTTLEERIKDLRAKTLQLEAEHLTVQVAHQNVDGEHVSARRELEHQLLASRRLLDEERASLRGQILELQRAQEAEGHRHRRELASLHDARRATHVALREQDAMLQDLRKAHARTQAELEAREAELARLLAQRSDSSHPPPLPARPRIEAASELPHELVEDRAYRLWIEEGRPEGRSTELWLRAESDVRASLASLRPS